MKTKLIVFAAACLFCITTSFGQDFLTPSYAFSHSKNAYVTLFDGTDLTCTVSKIKRKKGLISSIEVKDGSGATRKLSPGDVNYMYLPPNALDKISKANEFLNDATKWTNDKLDQDLLNQGLVYFEQTDVKIKKKTMTMLMQLLNPSFSGGVKVYHDPFAKETASIGVGGLKVAGGIAKSYYLKKGDDAAYFFEKQGYKKEFDQFWKDCQAVLTEFSGSANWNGLAEHVFKYDQECSGK